MSQARSATLGTLAVFSIACASQPPTPAPPPAAPAATVVTPTPVTPTRASLGPGEIVCGVDDGPVPIGQADEGARDDLRRSKGAASLLPRPVAAREPQARLPFFGEMMAEPPEPPVEAAKAEVELKWALGSTLRTTPAFEQRAHDCGELGEVGDLAERTFRVQSSASGPAASRDGSPTSSKLSVCFAHALCLLGPSNGGAPGEIAEVRLSTKITPPVFRGHVTIDVGDERRGPTRPGRSRRGRTIEAPPPPRPAASVAYAKQLSERLVPAAQACAAKRPPAESFVAGVVFVWGKDGKRALPSNEPTRPLVEAFERCLSAAADGLLTRPPIDFNPYDRIPILARVDTRPAPPSSLPPPATPPSASGRR